MPSEVTAPVGRRGLAREKPITARDERRGLESNRAVHSA